jgi:hypothetical protein
MIGPLHILAIPEPSPADGVSKHVGRPRAVPAKPQQLRGRPHPSPPVPTRPQGPSSSPSPPYPGVRSTQGTRDDDVIPKSKKKRSDHILAALALEDLSGLGPSS